MIMNSILTLPDFKKQFPWNKRFNFEPESKEYSYLWTYELAVSQEELWKYIMDSSRFNHAVGYEGIDYIEKEGVLIGSKGEGKFREEWVEFPFEWEYPNWITRFRKYSTGISDYNHIVFYSEKIEKGVRVVIYISTISKMAIAKKFVPAYLLPLEEKYKTVLKNIETSILNQKTIWDTFVPERIEISEEGKNLLKKYEDRLREVKIIRHELVDKLIQFILTSDRNILSKIRPLMLAREWDVDLNEVLVLLLYSVRIGLLTLSWDVICPHCRGAKIELPSLGKVPSKGSCDVCEISFENNQLNSIEVTFHLSTAIYDIPRVFYCSSEMSKKPHIYIQKHISSENFSFIFKSNLSSEEFRIRIKNHPDLSSFRISILPDIENRTYEIKGVNPFSEDLLLTVEEVSWGKDRLTPGALFNLQEFRDLFTEEHLSTDLQLDLGVQNIIFTDLVGSTKFYEKEGDAKAFLEVQKHFQLIYDIIYKYSGAVIKTVGDGAMLAFGNSISAMKAVLELKNVFSKRENDSPIRIKISAHRGNCLAVNLNTGIDYFGQTVNTSAKLQNGARPNSVIFSNEFLNSPGIKEYLEENLIKLRQIVINHPSLSVPLEGFVAE